MQIRRALEAICIHFKIDRENLLDALQDLASMDTPTLSADLIDMTTVGRILGNHSVHPKEQPLDAQDVSILDSFFRAVVESLFVVPARLAEYEKSLETIATKHPKVKTQIEKLKAKRVSGKPD